MIGEKLKELRKAKGLTISDSAKTFGVAPRTYSSYEAGEREPNISLINQFADFYGVTTDYLLGREPAPPNPFDALKLTKEQEADANAKYRILTPQDKAIVASIIQTFAEAHRNEPKPTQMTAVKSVDLYADNADSDEDSAQTA